MHKLMMRNQDVHVAVVDRAAADYLLDARLRFSTVCSARFYIIHFQRLKMEDNQCLM